MEPKAPRSLAASTEAETRVSAIVVAGEDRAPLELCLRSVLADPWVDELILVDDGAAPEAASGLRALKADRRDVTLLKTERLGVAKARNLAAACAKGRYLLFVDPGVVLQQSAVSRLVAAGRAAPSPWLAGGRLVDAKGREREGFDPVLPSVGGSFGKALGLPALVRKPKRTVSAGAVGRSLLLMPRADFDALGGFDHMGLQPVESLDLCRKVTEAGGEVRYAPRAEAVQFGRPARPFAAATATGEGLVRYLEKRARSPGQRMLLMVAAPVLRLFGFVRGVAVAASAPFQRGG